jgi:hypothetical protein
MAGVAIRFPSGGCVGLFTNVDSHVAQVCRDALAKDKSLPDGQEYVVMGNDGRPLAKSTEAPTRKVEAEPSPKKDGDTRRFMPKKKGRR